MTGGRGDQKFVQQIECMGIGYHKSDPAHNSNNWDPATVPKRVPIIGNGSL